MMTNNSQNNEATPPEPETTPADGEQLGNIWGEENTPTQYTKKGKAKRAKKHYTWGMPEVLISFIGLIVLQIILATGYVAKVIADEVAKGTPTDQLFEVTQKSIYNPAFLLVSTLGMYFCWAIMMWYSTKYRGHKSWFKDFWLKFKKVDLLIGLCTAIGAFILVQGLSALFTVLGVDMSDASNTQAFTSQTGIWKYILFIGVVSLLGPFMEELFFRGFLMQALIKHFRRGNIRSPRGGFSAWMQENSAWTFYKYVSFRNWCYKHKYAISAILSSAFFGLMHFQGTTLGQWTVVFITGSLGLLFAIIAIKTKRIGATIIGHVLYNLTVSIMALSAM